MRLIIPILFYRRGGVEQVIISLISHLVKYTEQIVIVLPQNDIEYFKKLLPDTNAIIYEPVRKNLNFFESKLDGISRRLNSILEVFRFIPGSISLKSIITERYKFEYRLNELIKKYNSTHCLYLLINRVPSPKLKIPLFGLIYDIFWHFSPLTYSSEYIEQYDRKLLDWLEEASIIFAISDKTRSDVLKLFPQFENKLKSVPLAGFIDEEEIDEKRDLKSEETVTFYFPSSFGIYKDHLTLFKAVVKLAQEGYKFKVILTGNQTDTLISGEFSLKQQKGTQEVEKYLEECVKLHTKYKHILQRYITGLGYCTSSTVKDLYKSCNCVVIPSQYEGFGLAISEAIMQGLPVIASDIDVFKEQVSLYQCSDRVDFFKVGNSDDLSIYMKQFIENPKDRIPRHEIRQRFYHWTWDDIAKSYVQHLSLG